MTLDEMVEQLNTFKEHGVNGQAVILAYNGDTEKLEEVTGFLYDFHRIELCTDDND